MARRGALLVLGLLLALAGPLPARAADVGPCPGRAVRELVTVTKVLSTRPNRVAVAREHYAGLDDVERMVMAALISWCLFENEAVELEGPKGEPIGSFDPARTPYWIDAAAR